MQEFKYLIKNGNLEPDVKCITCSGEKVIYEVIMILNKKPLFCEEHLVRMIKSVELSDHKMLRSKEELEADIRTLIEANDIEHNNIKIEMCFTGVNEGETRVFCIPSNYPDEETYKAGVPTVLYNISRVNPNVKLHNQDFKTEIEKIREGKYFEVILVNKNFLVCEGSRSNLFFVRDGKILTPKGENVLMGITREMVFKTANDNGIPIKELDIQVFDIGEFDAAFITGTSIGVLPLKGISNVEFDSVNNETVKLMQKLYNQAVDENIK